jgi:hypothetical protein
LQDDRNECDEASGIMNSSILNPVCRGVVGYVSYLASCSASEVYSEYLLYEPIHRIAQSKGFSVQCEFPVSQGARGDAKRIDFDLSHKERGKRLGLEVKWLKKKTHNFDRDIEKLQTYGQQKKAPGYLLIFGPNKFVSESRPAKFLCQGKLVEWTTGKTKYAARWFRVS